MLNVAPFSGFESSSRAVLAFLRQRIGFDLWMMTKKVDDGWAILQIEDHGYGVKEGTVLRWGDSFCARMIEGQGPRIAPRSKEILAYATAPIGEQLPIGAYIGVPVTYSDGSLFGTLCAIDPSSQQDSIIDELPLIELQAKFLGTVLESEQHAKEQARLLEICHREASTDALTQLLNRSGWDQCIALEESRADRYGDKLSIFIVDLDDLKQVNDSEGHLYGDALLQRTAKCLRSVVRKSDVVARMGGDEFFILALECGDTGAEVLLSKIKKTLSEEGIMASVGKATRASKEQLIKTIDKADNNMYADKAERK